MEPNFSDGVSLFELGIIAGSLSAIFLFLFLIWDRVIKKALIAWDVLDTRWTNTGKIDEILKAITPTNGDQASISERVDKAKKSAQEAVEIGNVNATEINALKTEFTSYQEEDSRKRMERQAAQNVERSDMLGRLRNLETQMSTVQSQLQSALSGNPEVRLPHRRDRKDD